jgi:nucleotide-binding universal stress UspA family protein
MSRKRILVPMDFGPPSDAALEFAGELAAQLNAMLSCIYVIEETGRKPDQQIDHDLVHKQRREAGDRLSKKVHSILRTREEVSFELIIASGKVHQKVLEKSIDLDAGLIVMGRSKSGRSDSEEMGSNARKIAANSLVPVITLPKRRKEQKMRLILPLDLDSSYSDQLNWGLEFALLLNASVSALAVTERSRSSLRPVYLYKLNETREFFDRRKIECSIHLLENRTGVSGEIISFSSAQADGIILMMNRQEHLSSKPYLGTMAGEVLAKADVPVLYIHSKNKSRYWMDQLTHPGIPKRPPTVSLEDHFN